ncbi:MAG: DUF4445 domain-containing protein [Firmicutes bacterium]|nr:DUF4445 domain-containing protein [Bacillota bacterium]
MTEIKLKVKEHNGKTLMEAMAEEGVQLSGTCGGMGTCGKCRVYANGQDVLACRHLVTEDVTVLVADDGRMDASVKESPLKLPEGFCCDEAEEDAYGIALDLGTTTVVVMLWDLHRGRLTDVKAVTNPQKHYGADVMSRIGFVLRAPWNLTRLQSRLINEINQAISRMTADHGIGLTQIRKITAVGNTTMSHLFLGEDVSGLAAYPFQPAFCGSVRTTARAVGLAAHEEAEVYVAPNMAGHVGSDITAGILASGYMEEDAQGSRLFLDIGTNGEIFLAGEDQSYCCSTAAGPAFEGSALHQGMRAADGAIYKVNLVENKVKCETVGDAPAKGICGSGIIDALAVLLETGIMDRFGGIETDFVLAEERSELPAVAITQKDIREVQMAKAAVFAGCKTLLAEAGLDLDDLSEIGIAGAFGNGICIESGIAIGLLPKTDPGRFRSLGNAAGLGASMMLLSEPCRKKAEDIAASAKHVELAALTSFQSRYIEEMNF